MALAVAAGRVLGDGFSEESGAFVVDHDSLLSTSQRGSLSSEASPQPETNGDQQALGEVRLPR